MNGPLFSQPKRSRQTPHYANDLNALTGQARSSGNEVHASRDRDAQLDRAAGYDPHFHPFKIYSFPVESRANGNYASDWRKFRVHGGRYNGVKVLNTDNHDTNPGDGDHPKFPDHEIPVAEGDGSDVTVPANTAQYWFWIDASNSAAPLIKSGYSGQSVSGNVGSPNSLGWSSFPTPDSTHIPIGWVDSNTDAANGVAFVRQYVRSDVFPTGSGGDIRTKVVKVYSAYIICEDCATPGTFYRAAKHHLLRTDYSGRTEYGETATFAYPHDLTGDALRGQYRTSTVDSELEVQVINPQFVEDDIIWITPYNDGVTVEADDETENSGEDYAATEGDPVTYEMKPDARAWAAHDDQEFGL